MVQSMRQSSDEGCYLKWIYFVIVLERGYLSDFYGVNILFLSGIS